MSFFLEKLKSIFSIDNFSVSIEKVSKNHKSLESIHYAKKEVFPKLKKLYGKIEMLNYSRKFLLSFISFSFLLFVVIIPFIYSFLVTHDFHFPGILFHNLYLPQSSSSINVPAANIQNFAKQISNIFHFLPYMFLPFSIFLLYSALSKFHSGKEGAIQQLFVAVAISTFPFFLAAFPSFAPDQQNFSQHGILIPALPKSAEKNIPQLLDYQQEVFLHADGNKKEKEYWMASLWGTEGELAAQEKRDPTLLPALKKQTRELISYLEKPEYRELVPSNYSPYLLYSYIKQSGIPMNKGIQELFSFYTLEDHFTNFAYSSIIYLDSAFLLILLICEILVYPLLFANIKKVSNSVYLIIERSRKEVEFLGIKIKEFQSPDDDLLSFLYKIEKIRKPLIHSLLPHEKKEDFSFKEEKAVSLD